MAHDTAIGHLDTPRAEGRPRSGVEPVFNFEDLPPSGRMAVLSDEVADGSLIGVCTSRTVTVSNGARAGERPEAALTVRTTGDFASCYSGSLLLAGRPS